MSKQKIQKVQKPRALFLTIEDIEYWLEVGCICPSLETLTEIAKNARKIKREKGNVIILWQDDGTFLVTNTLNKSKTQISKPQKQNAQTN